MGREQKQGPAHVPCTQDHLSQPSDLTPTHTPTLTPCKELAHPPWGASKGTLYLLSLSPAATGAPAKPYLNFSSGFSSIPIDWGRPRTLVGINPMLCRGYSLFTAIQVLLNENLSKDTK